MGETREALLHSCTVYLYRFDAQQGAYAQQTDSALGCALLGATRTAEGDATTASTTFKLLLYNAQKKPVLQLPVAAGARFTPQSDTYVHFYDAEQQNCTLRFRDAAESAAFLAAAAFVRAHAIVHASRYYKSSRGDKLAVSVDELTAAKPEGAGLTHGDVAGVAIQRWQGSADDRRGFFSSNPLEISKQPPVEATSKGDVKRIRLMPYDASTESDLLTRALAAEALVGMQKNAKRLVTVVSASTQEWFIAQIELVKVKKATRSSGAAPAADESESKGVGEEVKDAGPPVENDGGDDHAELVKRMASISRAGSQSSSLIASLSSRLASRKDSIEQPVIDETDASRTVERQGSSITDPPAGYVPVLLAGLQLPGERLRSLSRSNTSNPDQPITAATDSSSATSSFAAPSSLAAKVIAPLKHSPRGSAAISPQLSESEVGSAALSSEMEQLMKEQSDLEKLRLELEESKKKLQSEDLSAPATTASFTSGSSPSSSSVPPTNSSSSYKPWEKPGLIPTPFEPASFSSGSSVLSGAASGASAAISSANRWTPTNFDLVPSFSPTSFMPSSSLPSPPTPFASAMTPYGSRSLGGSSPFGGSAASNLTGEVENGISRLQRSSTSIESKLDDLQSKMDRLMNMQGSLKGSKYSTGVGGYSSSSAGLGSSSSSVVGGASTSSSSLIKNLEKALSQRDQIQEQNTRLQDSVAHFESIVEDLQTQHESLQLENRNLLDKLQNGSQLQQDKFRLELRNLQQQLSHTQEQMLMYQEENFHLRNQLAAKDEQLAKEKARLQEDVHKQLEQMQRQLQDQAQHDSRDALRSVTAEKKALESQLADSAVQRKEWQQERESLLSQLRQAQTQQQQIQSEKVRSQADQDSQVRELETQLQQARSESKASKQQADRYAEESQHLEELLMAKEEELVQMQTAKNEQEYAALSELLKEFMNDIYFHFQDAFDEDAEFTGKEIVMAIRKILKQNTMEILSRLEEFWQLQGHDSGHH